MKNILNHDAGALIIARIAVTIIPTPIDFNNLIFLYIVFQCLNKPLDHFITFYIFPQRKVKRKIFKAE